MTIYSNTRGPAFRPCLFILPNFGCLHRPFHADFLLPNPYNFWESAYIQMLWCVCWTQSRDLAAHAGPPFVHVFSFYRISRSIDYKRDLSMWISCFLRLTLTIAAETFASFNNFWEMRLGYSSLALVVSGLLSTSQAQCPSYTDYSQVNLLFLT